MTYLDDALEQIAAIRGQMARAGVYRGFRASAAAGSAVAAVAVAAAQLILVPDPGRHPLDYLDLWCGTAAACAAAVAAGVYLRYRRTASPTQRAMARQAASQFAPSLVVGGLLTYALSECCPAALWVLPGVWAMLFGLGVWATRPLLPRGTGAVAVFYVLSGFAAFAVSRAIGPFSPWVMAVPFGVGQSAAAFVLYWNLERTPLVGDGDDEPIEQPDRRWFARLRRRPVLFGLTVAAVTAVLGIALMAGVVLLEILPGGVWSTYPVADHDPMLTREASAAGPIIAAVQQYQLAHGRFPADAAEAATLLPASNYNPAVPQMLAGWTYFPSAKTAGFDLSRRLGWDPALVFHGTPTGGTWAFEPGDGDPERPVVLDLATPTGR